AHRHEGNALNHRHEVVLFVNRPAPPGTGRVVKEGRVVAAVRSSGQPLHVQPADQHRGVALPHEPRDGIVPRGLLIEPAGERRLRPEDHIRPVLRPNSAREVKQFGDHAVRWALPLLVEGLVGLYHANDPDGTGRQRAHPPRPVPPRERHRGEHRNHRPPPNRPPPPSPPPPPPPFSPCPLSPPEPPRPPARAC